MLTIRDLSNLKHNSSRVLIGFSYDVEDKDRDVNDPERACFTADWSKCGEGVWNMRVVLGRTQESDSQVYNFTYQMPRDGLPVELIAATGLKYFQMHLQEEIQQKSDFNFVLGDLLKGM